MAKSKSRNASVYACNECGAEFPKWAGQCTDCGAWNSLTESSGESAPKQLGFQPVGYADDTQITGLVDVEDKPEAGISTGMSELDRVLGGQLVAGAVILVGGDPGVGKSTLLLQCMADMAERETAVYVTGEESLQQVSLRAKRIGVLNPNLKVLTETCVERVIDKASKAKPRIMVIDSIQTLFTEASSSAPGSVSQVREAAAQLVRFAKQHQTAIFLVGHVTKEGAIAGPRVLEHMVDTVLYFENEMGSRYRVVRAVKNRFGAVNELGVFAMDEQGLKEVKNPSAIFLSRHSDAVSGSIIMVTREGTRPLLVEVQALVDDNHGGSGRRLTLGLDQNRLGMLLAVAHKHAGIAMFDQDVFVNVVGGMRVEETAADLSVLLAALSSFRDRPLPQHLVAFGEVGLAGEIRPVPNGEERLREAAKHGFKVAIVPAANKPRAAIDGLKVVGVKRLEEAIAAVISGDY